MILSLLRTLKLKGMLRVAFLYAEDRTPYFSKKTAGHRQQDSPFSSGLEPRHIQKDYFSDSPFYLEWGEEHILNEVSDCLQFCINKCVGLGSWQSMVRRIGSLF